MGKILLEGIEVMVRIGLLEEELYAPQDLLLSIEIEHDFNEIAETDEVENGTDYRDIVDHARRFCQSYDGKTLERFATELARDMKSKFSAQRVCLGVDKPRYVKKLGLRQIRVKVEC
jgi:dihydroneopterin aldolase